MMQKKRQSEDQAKSFGFDDEEDNKKKHLAKVHQIIDPLQKKKNKNKKLLCCCGWPGCGIGPMSEVEVSEGGDQ